ncbi:MAG: hypothetical protein HFG28_03035 [Eubacterium sp.]|nr:hypothetical protein [Eubacterium sp.]
MQKQVTDAFVFLPVPAELLEDARINVFLPLQFDISEEKLIVENVEDVGEIVCNGNCYGCPMSETRYDNKKKRKSIQNCKGKEVK